MAEKALEDEKRVMTVWEIWQVAENKGYGKPVASQADTLFVPLEALIYSDTSMANQTGRRVLGGK